MRDFNIIIIISFRLPVGNMLADSIYFIYPSDLDTIEYSQCRNEIAEVKTNDNRTTINSTKRSTKGTPKRAKYLLGTC